MKSEPRLTTDFLRVAYSQGYFPMPHPKTGEIYWFNPDPRAVLPLTRFHVSHSLSRTLKRETFAVTFNKAFRDIMRQCADREETWITEEFLEVYGELHDQGNAHSVEVWLDDKIVGGVYGVALGGAFFAESMFHRTTDASKVALFHLVRRLLARNFTLLEVQFLTPHLKSLGAVEIPASDYNSQLTKALTIRTRF